jgi:hypothetical protein
MQHPSEELNQTRATLNELFDRLGLPAYRFDVEADGEHWRLIVECEVVQGWQRTSLEVRRELFARAAAGERWVLEALARRLDKALGDCLRLV